MDERERNTLLSWCEQSISRNREKWMHRSTGPHWSDLRRFVRLYDLVREMQAEREVIIDSAAEEIAALKEKNKRLTGALVLMVREWQEYTIDVTGMTPLYTHESVAGREAIELLVVLGVMQASVGNPGFYVFVEDLA